MNQPPDWADLARNIAEHDATGPALRALVVANSRLVITEFIIPAFLKAVPNAVLHRMKQEVIFIRGSSVRFRAVAHWTDVENLRGMQFDLIFFDPAWRGTAEEMEHIRRHHRASHASR